MFSLPATLLVTVPFNRRPICPLSLSDQPAVHFLKKDRLPKRNKNLQCSSTWSDIWQSQSTKRIVGHWIYPSKIECPCLVGFQLVTILFAQPAFLCQLAMHHLWSPTTGNEGRFQNHYICRTKIGNIQRNWVGTHTNVVKNGKTITNI